MSSLKILENGPYLYSGELTIEYADGHTDRRTGVTALCRCGESGKKPMCDGAHAACGFKDAAKGATGEAGGAGGAGKASA